MKSIKILYFAIFAALFFVVPNSMGAAISPGFNRPKMVPATPPQVGRAKERKTTHHAWFKRKAKAHGTDKPALEPFAFISFFLAILSLVPLYGLLIAPIAFILAIISLFRFKKHPNKWTVGKKMAIAALILAVVSFFGWLIALSIILKGIDD